MIGRVGFISLFFTSLAFGINGQADFFHYNYTQKNYSDVLIVQTEDNIDRMSRELDISTRPITGQADFYEYSYTQKDYSDTLLGDINLENKERMSRGLNVETTNHSNGQGDYYDYLYTQRDYSNVLIEK